jgi:predicted acyltransferase
MEKQTNNRLKSLDALRGFDMLWIMGAAGIVTSFHALSGGSFSGWLSEQMEHVSWSGFHIMDLVFPLFLFIAGVSYPFSLAKRIAANESYKKIHMHLLKRALILVFLGIIYSNDGFKFELASLRYASVLSRIGLAWFFGALIFTHTKRDLSRYIWIFFLLLSYSLLIALVPAPGRPAGADIFSPEGNIVAWFDRMFLPGALYGGNFDPEGILGIIPAIATALIGMLAGSLLSKADISQQKKTLALGLAGISLIIGALLLNTVIPINKALWSPSFVLVAGGISLMLLTLFYWIIDVKGFNKWAFPLIVIGLNSITIYMAQSIIGFWVATSFFFNGFSDILSKGAAALIYNCGYVIVCWLFLWFLYKKKIFLKV